METEQNKPMFIIYAKGADQKRFLPMDLGRGVQVKNRIHATLIFNKSADEVESLVRELSEDNPGWSFESRSTK